jgi:hypothetical protein
LRDWYCAYVAELAPDDVVAQGMALAAAELRTAAEDARQRLLGGDHDAEASVTRLENAARRSALDLERRKPEPVGWWEQQQQQDDQEETDGEEGEEGSNSQDDH